MVQPFYEALGVDRDADAAAIDRAYRDRVKAHHPDVSDSPDAGDRFRRLTTARDVLVDEDERARYDELGHAAYLHSEGGLSGWPAPEAPGDRDLGSSATGDGAAGSNVPGDGTAGSSAAAAARAVARTTTSDGGPTGRDADSTAEDRSRTTASGTGAAGSSAGGTAASYYRPGHRLRPDAAASSMPGPIDVLRAVGPWAVVDLVLLTSALATAWMVMTVWSLSLGSILLASFLLAVAFCATVFHLSVKVAT